MSDIADADYDDCPVTSEYYGVPYCLDDGETLSMLKRNDPDVEYLNVEFNDNANPNSGFNPLSINWHLDGSAISKNTHLKILETEDWNQSNQEAVTNARDRRMLERNAKSFFRAVAANRSIEFLSLKGNIVKGMDVSETFSTLTGFFENNHNLCSFKVGYITLDSRTAQFLVSALSRCSAALEYIGLIGCDGLDGEILAKIMDVIASLPNIQCLNLDANDISDEAATALGHALRSIKSLKKLFLREDHLEGRRGSITLNGVEILSNSLADSSLEVLSLWHNDIGPEGGLVLAEALTGNSSLKVLDLHQAVSLRYGEFVMTSAGWAQFFGCLHNCAVQILDLGGNTIGDGDIVPMVDALNTMGSLTSLRLQVCISASGWAAFFDLLRRPGSVLERLVDLNISCCRGYGTSPINDREMISFAKSLVGNTTLQKFRCTSRDITKEGGWAALTRTLCNSSSLESICNSNHTFFVFKGLCCLDPETASLLTLNGEKNKAKVVRKKIIKYHFCDGDDSHNLRQLMSLKTEVLPWAIAWVVRDTAGFQLIHRLARGMPSLFDSQQQEHNQQQQRRNGTRYGGKRKWGL